MAEKKKNKLSEVIIDALAQAVQDVPAQLEDLISLAPRGYNALNLRDPKTGKSLGYEIPVGKFKSKLATETLPYLAEEATKPRKITGEEGVSGDLSIADVGLMGAIGAAGIQNAIQGGKYNAALRKTLGPTAVKAQTQALEELQPSLEGLSPKENLAINKDIVQSFARGEEVAIPRIRQPQLQLSQRGSALVPSEAGVAAKTVGKTAANVGQALVNKPILPIEAVISQIKAKSPDLSEADIAQHPQVKQVWDQSKILAIEAAKAQPLVTQDIQAVAQELGLTNKQHSTPKTQGSIASKYFRKVATRPNYSMLQEPDLTRGAVVLNDIKQLPAATVSLQNKGYQISPGWGEEKWGGYRTFHLEKVLPNGMSAEIQLHTQPGWEQKINISDGFYHDWREYLDMDISKFDPKTMMQLQDIHNFSKKSWEPVYAGFDRASIAAMSASANRYPSVMSRREILTSGGTGTQVPLGPSTNADLPSPQGRVSTTNPVSNLTTGILQSPSSKSVTQPTMDVKRNIRGSTMATGPEMRKFIETVKNSVATDPALRVIIDSRYTPKSNKVTLAEADTIINNDANLAYAMAMEPSKPSAISNAIAMRLISQAQAKGNWEEAKRLVETTAERNTAAGQAIQALAMYGKLSPEGVVSYASSVVNRARVAMREAKIKEFEKAITGITDDDTRVAIARKMNIPYISAKQLEEIYNDSLAIQKMPEGRDRMVKTALMLKKIADNVDPGVLSKISMLQTLSQLVNPKTVIRNILGNFVFATGENAAQTFATGLDVMASLITKQRTTTLPNLKAQGYGFYKGAREGLEEALLGINTRQLNTKFSLPRNGVFHKGVLGGLEKCLAVVLQAPDRAFFEQSYMDSLSGQMKLAKTTDPTPEMMEQATLDGLYKTFQDHSLACRALTGFKKALNVGKGWGVGDMVIKYPATPGNIWARGFEYTPGGFIKSMYHLGRLIKEHEKTRDQREFVRSMSRALTGSSLLFGVAAGLATLGIVSGKRDPNRNISALKRTVGLKSYQINISALKRFIFSGMDPKVASPEPNDILVSYDWMLPASIPMVVGANIVEEAKRRAEKETPQPGQAVAEGMAEAANSMVDQPMLSGISQMRKAQDIYSWLVGMTTDIPASFTPTIASQLTKLTDNIVRNTNDPNYLKQAYNKVINKMPIASKTLTPQLNVWGQPMKSFQGDTNSPFNVFLNPAFVSKYKPTLEAKMVLDIWERTGEAGVFPHVAPKTLVVGGRTVHLKPEMQKDYQEYIGNKAGVLFNILVNDPKFMAMPDELKAQKLQNYLTDINTSAKIELFGLYPKKTVRGQQVPYIPKRTQSILSLP